MIPLRNIGRLIKNKHYLFHNIRSVKKNYSYIENDFMGGKKGDLFWKELIEYCMREYLKKKKMKIYKKWKGRFVLQTTGPKMISRFVKKRYSERIPLQNIVYTKWNRDKKTGYYIQDLKLNSWVVKKGGIRHII